MENHYLNIIFFKFLAQRRVFVMRQPPLPNKVIYRSHIKVPCVPTSPCMDVSLIEGTLVIIKLIKYNLKKCFIFQKYHDFNIIVIANNILLLLL